LLIEAIHFRLTEKTLGTYLDDGDETKTGQVFYKLGEFFHGSSKALELIEPSRAVQPISTTESRTRISKH
jgi:hypothetical protein